MKQNYYDLTGDRDFFSVVNHIVERRLKRERARRVRRVRGWLLRKAFRDALHGRFFAVTAGVWCLVVAEWFWLHIVLPVIQA